MITEAEQLHGSRGDASRGEEKVGVTLKARDREVGELATRRIGR